MPTPFVQFAAAVGLVSVVLAGGCKRTAPDQSPSRLAACEGLEGRQAIDDCYAAQADRARDPAYCERIVGPAAKNGCFQKAALFRGAALCDKIDVSDQRARCVLDVAVAKKDPAGCDAIADPSTRVDCLVPLAIHEPLVCDRVKEPFLRDDCFSRALTDPNATVVGEPPCGRIADPTKQNLCWSMVAPHDPALCEKLSTTDDDRSRCFMTAVVFATSEVDCSKIPRQAGADLCFDAMSRKTRDDALCARIVDVEHRDACLVAVAVAWRSPAPCARIADATKQKACRAGAMTIPAASVWPASLEGLRHGGVTRTGPQAYTVTRSALRTILHPESATQLRMVPVFENGGVTGVRAFGITKESWIAFLGFENGDTVQRVNGSDIGSPATAVEVVAGLDKAGRVVVELTRRGAAQTLVYTIQ